MDKTITIPLFAFEKPKHGMVVYRMWLDEYFYIGSTINLSDRIRKHMNSFIAGKNYKLLSSKYKDCQSVRFEVIGVASDNTSLRMAERKFITKEIGNPFLLNSHGTTKAIIGFSTTKKLVKKINKDGSFVIFESIEAAAKDAGMNRHNFRRNMSFGYKIPAGVYTELDAKGNAIRSSSKPPHPDNYTYKRGPHKPIIHVETGIFWTAEEVVFLTGIHSDKLRTMLADPQSAIYSKYRYV